MVGGDAGGFAARITTNPFPSVVGSITSHSASCVRNPNHTAVLAVHRCRKMRLPWVPWSGLSHLNYPLFSARVSCSPLLACKRYLWGRWRAERATYPTDNRSRVLAGGAQCTEGHLRCNYQAEERQMR